MGRQRSQIDEVKRKITLVERDLEVLYGDLGLHLSHLKPITTTKEVVDCHKTLTESKEVLSSFASRLENLRALSKSLDDAHITLGQLKKNLALSNQKLKETFGRIGVIIWEEAASKVISNEIFNLIPEVPAKQKELANLNKSLKELEKLLSEVKFHKKISIRYKIFKVNQQLKKENSERGEFFILIGKKLAQNDLIKLLASKVAEELNQLYRNLLDETELYNGEIEKVSNQISSGKKELQDQGVVGSVEKKIGELVQKEKEQSQKVTKEAIKYAHLIYQEEIDWNKEDFNNEILESYEQIERHKKIKKELEKQQQELLLESEIGQLLYFIEQDQQRIEHIQKSIDQYNRQIDQIKNEIKKNREEIGKLKEALKKSLEQKG